uniref:Uncharacterized protein n=1 Tax=Anopheles quadriannulatus TaxID=34691 RepID=A0A182XR12_ANOQN
WRIEKEAIEREEKKSSKLKKIYFQAKKIKPSSSKGSKSKSCETKKANYPEPVNTKEGNIVARRKTTFLPYPF